MTRAQAVKRVAERLQGRTPDKFPAYTDADKIVEALDVLGLVKFEEPRAPSVPPAEVIARSTVAAGMGGDMRQLIGADDAERIILNLEACGFQIVPKDAR